MSLLHTLGREAELLTTEADLGGSVLHTHRGKSISNGMFVFWIMRYLLLNFLVFLLTMTIDKRRMGRESDGILCSAIALYIQGIRFRVGQNACTPLQPSKIMLTSLHHTRTTSASLLLILNHKQLITQFEADGPSLTAKSR